MYPAEPLVVGLDRAETGGGAAVSQSGILLFCSDHILTIPTTVVVAVLASSPSSHLALFRILPTSSNDDCLAARDLPAPISGHSVPEPHITNSKWLPLLQQRRRRELARKARAPIICRTATLICPAPRLKPLGKSSPRTGSISCLCLSSPYLLLARASMASITRTKSSSTRSTLERYCHSRHFPSWKEECTKYSTHRSLHPTTSNEPTSLTSTLLLESFYLPSPVSWSATMARFSSTTSETHTSPIKSHTLPIALCQLCSVL